MGEVCSQIANELDSDSVNDKNNITKNIRLGTQRTTAIRASTADIYMNVVTVDDTHIGRM